MTFIFCSLVCAKCDSPFILGERISLCLYQFVSNFLLNLSCRRAANSSALFIIKLYAVQLIRHGRVIQILR